MVRAMSSYSVDELRARGCYVVIIPPESKIHKALEPMIEQWKELDEWYSRQEGGIAQEKLPEHYITEIIEVWLAERKCLGKCEFYDRIGKKCVIAEALRRILGKGNKKPKKGGSDGKKRAL